MLLSKWLLPESCLFIDCESVIQPTNMVFNEMGCFQLPHIRSTTGKDQNKKEKKGNISAPKGDEEGPTETVVFLKVATHTR